MHPSDARPPQRRRSRPVGAAWAAAAWAAAVVVATLIGLTAVGAIGSGIVGTGQDALTPAEVDARLAAAASPAAVPTAAMPADPAAASTTPPAVTSDPAPGGMPPGATAAPATGSAPTRTQPPGSRPPAAVQGTRSPETPRAPEQRPSAEARVVASQGGTIVARCFAGGAEIVSVSPAQGYRVHDEEAEHPGRVTFEGRDSEVVVQVSCRDGVPYGETRVEENDR